MPASIKGITTLVFGCDVVSAVIMQTTDSDVSGEVSYVQDEDADFVAFALHSSGKREATGEYVYKGDDIVTAIFDAVTLSNAVGSGALFVYTYGRKQTNTGFMRGTFKAAGVEGITS